MLECKECGTRDIKFENFLKHQGECQDPLNKSGPQNQSTSKLPAPGSNSSNSTADKAKQAALQKKLFQVGGVGANYLQAVGGKSRNDAARRPSLLKGYSTNNA